MHPFLSAQLADDRARALRAAADRHRLVAPARRRRRTERIEALVTLTRSVLRRTALRPRPQPDVVVGDCAADPVACR